MSLEVLIIPLGILAYRAVKEARRSDLCEKCRQTRITDRDLLLEALSKCEATEIRVAKGVVTAQHQGRSIRFQVVEAEVVGRVDGGTEAETLGLIANVEDAAGRIIQARKVEEVRLRAAQLGLQLVGEQVADDGTVELIFEEVRT